MAKHIAYGTEAEKAAVTYLIGHGYALKATNFRYRRAEVDIIAQHGNTLVFVEVKARSSNRNGWPEDAVQTRKQDLLLAAADHYIDQTNWQGEARFDIISITGSGPRQELHHIIDAFH